MLMIKEQRFPLELACLTFFLVVGPIYWLPGLPSFALFLVKAGSLALLLMLPYLSFRKEIYAVPPFLPSVIVGTLILAAVPAAASLSFSFLSYLVVSAFVVLGYSLAKYYGPEAVLDCIFYSVIGFSVFGAVVFIDFVSGGIFLNPIHETRLYLYQTGFHGGRTGWTGICNLFLAFALIGLYLGASGLKRSFLIFSVVTLLLNLFLVDSRGGLLTGAVVVAFYLFALGRDSKAKLVLLSIVFVSMAAVFFHQFSDRLLVSRIYLSVFAPEELRSGITSGRAEGYLVALDLYLSAPLLGLGDVDMREFGQEVEKVHNVWLRVLVEQGLLGFLALLFFAFSVFLSLFRKSQHPRVVYVLLLTAGLLPTLFEPTGVFGNFFATSLFWVALGVFIGENNAEPDLDSRAQVGSR